MDQASAAAMHISKQSCSRYGVNISKYLQAKTVNVMEGVASVSIMFDEASDIQMHKHLNVFVNVSFFLCCIFVGIQSTSSVAICWYA